MSPSTPPLGAAVPEVIAFCGAVVPPETIQFVPFEKTVTPSDPPAATTAPKDATLASVTKASALVLADADGSVPTV